jgi:hypothetical protein
MGVNVMSHFVPALEDRVLKLERTLARTRFAATAFGLGLIVLLAGAFVTSQGRTVDEIRTHRLVIVDDAGTTRLLLAQDPANTQRISRAAGLLVFDDKGNERGGLSTMADGSVVLGLDAPVGVGAPMRDRIGLKVEPDGAAYVMLIDNQTRAVAKLHSDSAGAGGVQVFKWDMPGKQVHIRTLKFDGDVRDSVPFGR